MSVAYKNGQGLADKVTSIKLKLLETMKISEEDNFTDSLRIISHLISFF